MRRALLFVSGVLAALTLVCGELSGEIWKFDFGRTPGASRAGRVMDGFTPITVSSDYSDEKGFGWVGASGEVKQEWLEIRGGMRGCGRSGGVDPLQEDYMTSDLPFEVKVPNGDYIVHVMMGDWGAYEYYPQGLWVVQVEGKEIGRRDARTQESFEKEFLQHKYDLFERFPDLFKQYVESRHPTYTGTVTVTDGRLTLFIERGPDADQYNGPINMMVLYPLSQKAEGDEFMRELTKQRKDAFEKKFKIRREYRPCYPNRISNEERERGFASWPVDHGEELTPHSQRPRGAYLTELTTFATPGEYEPVCFVTCPLDKKRGSGKMTVTCSDLKGSRGGEIPASEIQCSYVRFLWEWIEVERYKREVVPRAGLVMDRNWVDSSLWGVARPWWITVHVPEDAKPDLYTGAISIVPEYGQPLHVPFKVTVLPFKLDEPNVHYSLNYSADHYPRLLERDDPRRWDLVRREMTFMRQHGMTSVASSGKLPSPDKPDETSDWERVLRIYQETGFTQPFYHAGLMNYYNNAELRRNYGGPLKKEWQDAYCAIFRAYDEIAKKLNQKVVYSIGDETTNGGREALIIQVGKVVNERLPDLITCSDINGYRELMGLAPYLDIVGFNNGWHGSYSTNRRGRRLITRDVVERVIRKGAVPWFINGGVGRVPFGVFFWKMNSFGVQGHLQWHYYAVSSDPYNPFDSQQKNDFGSLVYPDCIPRVKMEECREGIDDFRYLKTFERMIAEAEKAAKDPRAVAAVERAKYVRNYYYDEVPDRKTGAAPDGAGLPVESSWPPRRLQEMRREVAQMMCLLLDTVAPGVLNEEYLLMSFEEGERGCLGGGGGARVTSVPEHSTIGKTSGRCVFPGGKGYVDQWGRLRAKDWRGYRTLRFDVTNPHEKEIKLTLNVRDQLAANTGDYDERYMQTWNVKPGLNTLTVNLVGIRATGSKRLLDLSCVFNIFFTVQATDDVTLYFDNVRISMRQ